MSDRCVAERFEEVGFAGAGRSADNEVLVAVDPLERGQRPLCRRRDRRHGLVPGVEGLAGEHDIGQFVQRSVEFTGSGIADEHAIQVVPEAKVLPDATEASFFACAVDVVERELERRRVAGCERVITAEMRRARAARKGPNRWPRQSRSTDTRSMMTSRELAAPKTSSSSRFPLESNRLR